MQTSTWFAKHTLTDSVEGHWQDNELGSEKIGWNGQNFKYPLDSVYLLRCFPRSLFCKLCNVFGTMLTCQIVSFHTTEAILADSVCFQSANGQTDYWHRVIFELVKILKSKLFAQSIIWKQNQMFVQVKANSWFYCGKHTALNMQIENLPVK